MERKNRVEGVEEAKRGKRETRGVKESYSMPGVPQ